MSSDQSSALALVKKLRKYEEEHPVQAIAAGFNPAYGAVSSGAALADPDAPWWEKLLAAPGLVPGLGGASKATVLLAARLRKHPKLFAKAAKFIDPFTGKKMAEISDSKARFDFELADRNASSNTPMQYSDVVHHPDLFEAEPQLAEMDFQIDPSLDYGTLGQYHGRSEQGLPGLIKAKELPQGSHDVGGKIGFLNTIMHEGQHGTDDIGKILVERGDLPGNDYWFDPDEIRARVTADRIPFSEAGRAKYSFDKHMMDEHERLKNRLKQNRGLGPASQNELLDMVEGNGLSYSDLVDWDSFLEEVKK